MTLGNFAKLAGVLALILPVAGMLPAGGALATESPLEFWLRQPSEPHGHRLRSRHPLFRPQRDAASVQRQPSLPVRQGSVDAPPRANAASTPPTAPAGFVVAVFGDGFGADLARGLATDGIGPKITVVDATSEHARLSDEPVTAWVAALDVAAKSSPVDAAVMMLGAEDLQPSPDGQGGSAAPGSPAWTEAYGRRVEAVARLFRDRHVPLVWVGLPPVRDPALAARMADLNAVVREHAGLSGATFVDTWEGFADDGGQYAQSGPDVDGRTVRLRHGDGFTAAGARKLASFAKADLKREEDRVAATRKLAALGTDDQALFDQALAVDVGAQIRREAGLPPLRRAAARAKDGPVLPLTAPPMAEGAKLERADAPTALSADAEAVLVSGLMPPARPGRIDDFTWTKP